MAFARCRSPEGGALVKVFKDMIKQGTLQTATQKTVILIDPEDFPTVSIGRWWGGGDISLIVL